jgi:hypothetical protein
MQQNRNLKVSFEGRLVAGEIEIYLWNPYT